MDLGGELADPDGGNFLSITLSKDPYFKIEKAIAQKLFKEVYSTRKPLYTLPQTPYTKVSGRSGTSTYSSSSLSATTTTMS